MINEVIPLELDQICIALEQSFTAARAPIRKGNTLGFILKRLADEAQELQEAVEIRDNGEPNVKIDLARRELPLAVASSFQHLLPASTDTFSDSHRLQDAEIRVFGSVAREFILEEVADVVIFIMAVFRLLRQDFGETVASMSEARLRPAWGIDKYVSYILETTDKLRTSIKETQLGKINEGTAIEEAERIINENKELTRFLLLHAAELIVLSLALFDLLGIHHWRRIQEKLVINLLCYQAGMCVVDEDWGSVRLRMKALAQKRGIKQMVYADINDGKFVSTRSETDFYPDWETDFYYFIVKNGSIIVFSPEQILDMSFDPEDKEGIFSLFAHVNFKQLSGQKDIKVKE